MKRFGLTQRGASLLKLLTIAALIAISGVVVSTHLVPTSNSAPEPAQPRPLKSSVANLVRGYIVATPTGQRTDFAAAVIPTGKDVYLPGVTVYLEEVSTSAKSTVADSDLSGRFTLYVPAVGRYHLCWKSAVYGDGCGTSIISAGSSPQFLSAVRIPIAAKRGYVAMTGHVITSDGSLPRTFDPLLNINAFATVGLDDSKRNRVATVYVNNFGDYLLPYVPIKENIKLTAAIESGSFSREIWPEARIDRAPVHRVDFRIENNRPQLNPLVAFDAGNKRVQNATTGSVITVQANARDIDGDPVNFSWFLDPNDGQLSQTTGQSVKWTVPTSPGRHSVTVVAYDNKGGYDKAVLAVLVGNKGIPFTGIVVEPSGAPVSQAEVEIVGNPIIKTGPDGRFATTVTEADRYVFNIRKTGYALNSQIYDRAVTGGRWILRRGQVVTIDPTRDEVIVHKRGERDCPGPDSIRASLGPAKNSLLNPQWQDGKGRAVDPPSWWNRKGGRIVTAGINDRQFEGKRQPIVIGRNLKIGRCRAGVSVKIPKNSILDASGNPANVPFQATLSTVDLLSPQQMPGDDSVLSGTQGGNLESFGAGALDFPAGFRLKPGATATVTIPVDRSRLGFGALPPTVPYLTYDEKRGLWIDEGTMTLTNIAGVQSYVGTAKHFSPFNADNVKNNTAACVRVFSPTLPGQYDLEVSAPLGGTGAPKVLTKPIDNTTSSEHVIYNLPNNTNITLAPMTQGANPQLLGFYIVNSGNPQNPNNSPDVPPGPPYTSCQNFVILKTGSAPDSPFGGEFLHGLGNIEGANLGFNDLTSAGPTGNALRDAIVAASRNYYSSVDPTDLRTTFDAFKSHHGFSADPNTPVAGETVAQYANSGDLGFGRDMHCLKKTNNDVACYVTNYGFGYSNNADITGTSDHDDAEAAAARATVGNSNEVATVAMEFAPIENAGTNKVVKFFVYKKNFPNAGDYGRSISANLDGRGERPVPQLCMICHGGQIPSQSGGVPAFGNAAQVDLGSRFIPFDHRLFTFPVNPSKAAQEAAFKTLNEQIVNSAPPVGVNDSIREVVTGLYNNGVSATQILNFDVPGWVNGASANVPGQSNFYQKVVANGCRICHTAQPFPQLQFNTSQKFMSLTDIGSPNTLMLGTAQLRVCGDYTMPHAFRTHEVLWGTYTDIDPLLLAFSMPVEFQNFGNGAGSSNWKAGLCTSFISNNAATPSNFYQQSIQPIFNGKCIFCHSGSFPPAGLNLAEVSPPDSPQSSWKMLLNGRVIPGNDNGSLLVQKITSTGANRMPPGCVRPPAPLGTNLPCLSQPDVDRIKAWIRSGAN
ncbi:MAG: Ig-like domain-containing protein [Pyrinomonadaceae bacterium]